MKNHETRTDDDHGDPYQMIFPRIEDRPELDGNRPPGVAGDHSMVVFDIHHALRIWRVQVEEQQDEKEDWDWKIAAHSATLPDVKKMRGEHTKCIPEQVVLSLITIRTAPARHQPLRLHSCFFLCNFHV